MWRHWPYNTTYLMTNLTGADSVVSACLSMQVTVFANELSLVPIKLWSYTHIAFAGKGSSLYDRATTKAPLYTAKPSSLKCLVYEKVSPPAPLTHPVKSGKRLLETENTIIQLQVRLWWQGAPIWLNTIAAIRGYWTLRETVSNWTFLYTFAVGNFLILLVSCIFYRCTVHSVLYLIIHTNKCIYIYYLRSLKFTLKHLKRSCMFRLHNHLLGVYIVPC